MLQSLNKDEPCAVRVEGFVAIQFASDREYTGGGAIRMYKFFMHDEYDKARDFPAYNGGFEDEDPIDEDMFGGGL